MRISKLAFYGIVSVIVGTSFWFFSPRYYPLLSSDDALNVLMAYDYHLPENLYCWGQDRGGTIIPFLSQFLLWLGFSPIIAVSVVNYILITIGYLALASLFKRNSTKILLAVLWFFPFKEFIDLIRYPIGIAYSLVACFILLLKNSTHAKGLSRRFFYPILMVILALIAVWVSDLAAVSLLMLFAAWALSNKQMGKHIMSLGNSIWLLLGSLVITTLIFLAKNTSSYRPEEFATLNSMTDALNGMAIVGEKLLVTFTFSNDDFIGGLFSWLTLFSFLFLLLNVKKTTLELTENNRKWLLFFTLDFLVILAVIFSSQWVFKHDMGRWYFVATYISGFMILLISWDNFKIRTTNLFKAFSFTLVSMVLIAGSSTFYQLRLKWPGTFRSKVDLMAETIELNKAGIIGDFWNSYILAVAYPDKIIATPHQQSNVKNPNLVDQVFEQPRLYVVKDMWLDSFPDEMNQFGYRIKKIGTVFHLAGCDMCEYERVKVNNFFDLKALKTNQVLTDSSTLVISPSCQNCKENYVLYGPHISMGAGEYQVGFVFLDFDLNNDSVIARLEITSENGLELHEKKLIYAKDFSIKPTVIKLNVRLKKRVNNLEFRMYYLGNGKLEISGVQLVQLN